MGHEELPRTAQVPAPSTSMLRVARRVAAALLGRWYDVHLHGAEHVPVDGPVLFTCNHIGLLDGPVLSAFAPRLVHALVKREMFDSRGGATFRGLGQISVERNGVDPFAVKQALRVLRDGGTVAIYPEGSRGRGDVTHSRLGVSYLALATGAAVVPVAHLGTRLGRASVHSVPPRGARIDVVVGAPLRAARAPTPWPRRQSDVKVLAEELRVGLARHVQDAVLLTGQRLPEEPPDVLDDVAGRRGHEVGPQAEGQVS